MKDMRGVWLPATGSQVLFSKENTIDAINRLADAGFNTVCPNVWWRGYTLYPSQVMNERFGVEIKPDFAGRDPLADVVEAAKTAGLKVIAWFEYGFIASYQANGGHILAQYPHWAAQDSNQQPLPENFDWMNGLHPEVQEFILSLFLEVATNYDIDGLQGDDHLSIPVKSGYDPYTIEAYYQEFGEKPPIKYKDKNWMRWRSDRLTDFIARLYQAIKLLNPQLLVSMAPSEYPFSYENFLVNSPEWLERGIVDTLHPQLYHAGVQGYRSSVTNTQAYASAQIAKVFPGMALEPNQKRFSPDDFWTCIQHNRQAGIRGECLWVYEQLRKNDDEVLRYLQAKNYGDRTKHLVIRRGMSGDDVAEIQQLLVAKGYDIGPIDGQFGARTDMAVRAFQKQNGLLSDGIVGAQTYAKLIA
jgi:uncharacterized lipoprotein YddW (UPF0748 family)